MLDALLNAYAALWRVDTLGVGPQPKPSASSVAPASGPPNPPSKKKLPSMPRMSIDDRLRALMGPMITEEELTAKLAFGRLLGSGATSTVFSAVDTASGREVSVKVFDKASMIEVRRSMAADGSSATEEKAVHRVRRRLLKILSEMEISKSLEHPNIIKYLGAYETPHRLCIVHELVEGTDLLEHLLAHGKMDEDVAASVFLQLLSALEYCHEKNVYHRDLKLENVLITADMTVKLIDFGLSEVVYPGELLYTMCGTPLYCSPEILFLHTKRRSASPSAHGFEGGPADVWSIGVLIFALLTGCAPFDDSSFQRLRHEVARRSIAYPSHLSGEVKGLLKSMLVFDAHMRPTVKDLIDYEWFQRERAVTSATDDSTNVALSRTMIEHLEEITTDSEILSESISDLDEDEMDLMDELGVEVDVCKRSRSLSYRSNGSRTDGTSSSGSSLEDSLAASEAHPVTSVVAAPMPC